MAGWLAANLSTIIITAVLVLVVGLVIRKLIKDKKRGKSSCGCGCAKIGRAHV